jgi:hypothetical protein
VEHQVCGQRGQDPCPPEVVGAHEVEGVLAQLDQAGLGLAGLHEERPRPDAGHGCVDDHLDVALPPTDPPGLLDAQDVLGPAQGAEGQAVAERRPTQGGQVPRTAAVVVGDDLGEAISGGLVRQRLEVALGRQLHAGERLVLDAAEAPVVGQLVVVGTAQPFDRLGHLAVGQGEPGRAQLVEQRRAQDGVGEAEATDVHLADQRQVGDVLQQAEHLGRGPFRGRRQEVQVERQPDHRGGAQERAGRVREPSETLTDDVPHRIGDGEPVTGAPLDQSGQLAGRGEVVEELAHEERAAGALLADPAGEGRDAVGPGARGPGADQGGDVVDLQGREVDGRGRGQAVDLGEQVPQRVARRHVLGPVAAEQQQSGGGGAADEVAEQLDGRPAGPLEVVQDEDDRLDLGQALDEAEHGLEQVVPGRGGGVVDPAGASGREQGAQRPRPLVDRGAQLLVVVGHLGEGRDERMERHRQVAVGGAGQHPGPVGVGPLGHLGQQSGLAHARVGGHQHDARRARSRLAPAGQGPAHLVGPADQREPPVRDQGSGQGPGGGVRRGVDDPDDGGGLVEALQLVGAHLLEGGVQAALAEALDEVGGQDLAGLGSCLQPGRLDHGDAVLVVVLEDHLPDADPDPDAEGAHRVLAVAVPGHAALHVDGRPHRGRRRREGGLQPVPGPAQHPALVGRDHRAEQRVVVPAERVRPVVTELAAQPRRADDVGEQDRPDPRRPPPPHPPSS